MTTYHRPRLPDLDYPDPAGQPIRYGHRWDGQPPEDSYSVSTHPERFAPLHQVADALLEHLTSTYDVHLEQDSWFTREKPGEGTSTHRELRLTPSSPMSAPLRLAWTDFPGVVVQAGLVARLVEQQQLFPVCGCDACDDDLEHLVQELEELVLAVAEGRFHERLLTNGWQWSLTTADGSGRSSESAEGLSADIRRAATQTLSALPDGRWQPWPLKSAEKA
ncbi:DUF6226 family protein [Nesterenkonia massiliensis]|uniref:DUF6226 family protein n=1 Tax=Nesterenkonia massiliensis TaxID=1232429 RepID=UPI0011C74BBF|nr:DUF6226 family protein [Nesterenkonia massiliensis]